MTEAILNNPGLSEIESPALRDFYSRWHDLKDDKGVPLDDRFEMTNFEDHLTYMTVVDYHRDKNRYFSRFTGAGHVAAVGLDHSNTFIDEIENTHLLLDRLSWLVEHTEPYLATDVSLIWSPKDFKVYDVLSCPLCEADGTVVRAIVRTDFSR